VNFCLNALTILWQLIDDLDEALLDDPTEPPDERKPHRYYQQR
jgi:hypothetical protein